ncbi:hypothetical protein CORC01_03761 [Colletotrichum orchidophilum]|uniref:Uncharacterized protein n=1 Tax=Colletotrichum orchidophilum TaxID=1209926 RepID=A0A1G4BHX3_9PEZI|nr:uncharacterized protein CORC01_03761 [Colletotrichum orchidophilum]OHF00933.1 hypothetical protein CORC01_03761 [Colletotrichum orchidophilum]
MTQLTQCYFFDREEYTQVTTIRFSKSTGSPGPSLTCDEPLLISWTNDRLARGSCRERGQLFNPNYRLCIHRSLSIFIV